jgi:hypothetical protein
MKFSRITPLSFAGRLGVLFAWALLASAGARAAAAQPDVTPLSADDVRTYARQAAAYLAFRQGCGQGRAFQGATASIVAARSAFLAKRSSSALPTLAATFSQRVRAAQIGLQASYIDVGSLETDFGHLLNDAVTDGSGVVAVNRWIRTTNAELEQDQKQLNAMIAVAAPGSADYARIEAAQTAMNALLDEYHAVTQSEGGLARSTACADSEWELNHIVDRVSASEAPEDSNGVIPDTFAGQEIKIGDGHCHTLDQFSEAVGFVLKLSNDTSYALMDSLTQEERAVLTQLVADFVRAHGDANGQLSDYNRGKLNTLVTALQQRFMTYADHHAQ